MAGRGERADAGAHLAANTSLARYITKEGVRMKVYYSYPIKVYE